MKNISLNNDYSKVIYIISPYSDKLQRLKKLIDRKKVPIIMLMDDFESVKRIFSYIDSGEYDQVYFDKVLLNFSQERYRYSITLYCEYVGIKVDCVDDEESPE